MYFEINFYFFYIVSHVTHIRVGGYGGGYGHGYYGDYYWYVFDLIFSVISTKNLKQRIIKEYLKQI